MLPIIFALICAAQASVFQLYGLGARNTSLGNATVSMPTDAFSFQYNPALMVWQKNPLFSAGFLAAVENFEKINSVIVDTPELGADTAAPDGGRPVRDVNTDVPNSYLLMGAISTPLSKGEKPLHFGLNFAMPVDKMMGTETQDAFVPQYSQYLSDTQRLTIATALAYQPWEEWGFGLGGNIYLNQAATSRFRLPAAAGNRTSTGLFKADVRQGIAGFAGTSWKPSEHWMIGLVWQQAVDVKSDINANNDIYIMGSAPFQMRTTSSLYYDPEIWELGVRWLDSDYQTLMMSARYEKWSPYAGSVLRFKFDSFTGSFQQVLPNSNFHDVISARAGYERKFSKFVGRAGYEYKPSPVPNQDQAINYVDSDKHVATLGGGFDVWSLRLDAATFFQYLIPKTVTKVTPPAGTTYVGSPGYKIGGWVAGAVVTMSSEL